MDDVLHEAIRSLIGSMEGGLTLLKPFIDEDLAWTGKRAEQVLHFLNEELGAGIQRVRDSMTP